MGDNNSVVIVRKPIQNPFALKVGQVFTGFGVGCGLGIGVGRPINLGAIPVLNQVMSATRGATDAFSGIGRHVNHSLKVVGAKNIEAGIGCGIGFGHGFGVGLAIKPGVVNQIQSFVVQAAMNMMVKFGMVPNLSAAQNILPSSVQNSKTIISDTDSENPIGSMLQFGTKAVDSTSQDGNFSKASRHDTSSKNTPMLNTSYGSRTEKVINSFLQTSLVENEELEAKNSTNESLQSVNHMMQLVLKHQVTIEELREENAKLRQILIEDLKLSPEKFKGKHSSTDTYSCTECFECRRKQRRKR